MLSTQRNKKINLALICGGPSSERRVSFNSAKFIYKHVNKNKYDVKVYDIKSKTDLLKIILDGQTDKIDIAFIALHGKFGEDGKIQAILDTLKIPYTGSNVLASALGMHKIKTLELLNNYNIRIPRFIQINKKDNIQKINKLILEEIKYPCVVKPNQGGSSIGVTILNESDKLETAINHAFKEDGLVLIEEFIKGREMTCGILGNSNQTNLIAMPPVEIIPGNSFFDYEAKYFSEQTQEICPAEISEDLTEKIKNISKKIHNLLDCGGLTRSDFILKNNEFYFLEINTIPGLTEVSLCPKEAKAIGMSFSKFIDIQIDLALKQIK
jgi:D-alanine-D-alanine ligase